MTLLYAVISALIAGVILNLMPCVFPVLSIKILHLTRAQGGDAASRASAWHGLCAGDPCLLHPAGRRAPWAARRRRRDRLGLSIAVAADGREPGVHSVRAGIEPLRHSDHRHVADARRRQPPAAAGRPVGLVFRRRAGNGGGDALHRAVHGRVDRLCADPAVCRRACGFSRARAWARAAVPGSRLRAGPAAAAAAAGTLDGDAEAVPRLPALRHGGLADLGSQFSGRPAGPACRTGGAGADRFRRMGLWPVARAGQCFRPRPSRHGRRLGCRRRGAGHRDRPQSTGRNQRAGRLCRKPDPRPSASRSSTRCWPPDSPSSST